MSQFECPMCGKFTSIKFYSPEDFDTEINIVQVRGLGRGKGVKVIERYSIFEGENQELVDKIGERVAVLYDLFWDDEIVDDDNEELLDDVNEAIGANYDNQNDATMELLELYLDLIEDE